MIPPVPKLIVHHRDTPVGTLQQDPDGTRCVFEYDRQWLSGGFSLSPTELPLTSDLLYADPDKFGGNFATFEDSLPDGYGLYLLERILRGQGTSLKETTPLQRLALIGQSGMGALNYRPSIPSRYKAPSVSLEELDLLQEKALEVLSEKNDTDTSLLYYISANSGGARPKIVFSRKDGTHWLIKFRHTYDPLDLGETELLYMKTARECGIRIPRIGLVQGKYFAIERFDINPAGNRVHMLTASALLKTPYQNMDIDYTHLLALTGYLTQDPIQVEEMFRRMVFNLVAINKDDHGKNFSFLCHEGRWTLAPAYDLTYSPSGSRGEHATSLFYDGNPGLDLVLKAGTGIRIPEKRCREIVDSVQDICARNLPKIAPLAL